MFRDDAVIVLVTQGTKGTLTEIVFEHNIEGPGNWIFGYTTEADFRVACVGRHSETNKPTILWDNPA